MSATLDMERVAKELGADRCRKVATHGGYFGSLQLAAHVASHSRVSNLDEATFDEGSYKAHRVDQTALIDIQGK